MRLQQRTGQTCQETTGFLFSHPCSRPADNQCDQCQKLTCSDHTVEQDAKTYCTTCAKQLARAAGTAGPARFPNRDPDDPFWYSDWHYRGYGYYGPGYWGHSYVNDLPDDRGSRAHAPHDPNDFTEADTASVQAEGDANFENEIGGS